MSSQRTVLSREGEHANHLIVNAYSTNKALLTDIRSYSMDHFNYHVRHAGLVRSHVDAIWHGNTRKGGRRVSGARRFSRELVRLLIISHGLYASSASVNLIALNGFISMH